MRRRNIIRSIFWGFIALICLSAGITGLIYHNKMFNEKKNDLERIVTIFNNTQVVKNYEKVKTYIEASLDGKNIRIKYEGVENKEYLYKLKNGYLETKLNKEESIDKILLMVLADSIAINNGQKEGETYELFNNDTILNYNLDRGIEFIDKKTYYIVKINLENYIQKITNIN